MRTGELIKALSQENPGIRFIVTRHYATCTTLYDPPILGRGKTAFNAAFETARQLFKHPECPPCVKVALDKYEQQTCNISV